MTVLPMPPLPACAGRFDLDIASAIADQLGDFLGCLPPEPLLNDAVLARIPKVSGVYCLHHGGGPAYIGKASSLQRRLLEHASDLDGRQNISRQEVSFTCAMLSHNWAPFGAEDILMARARLKWQGTGFGNNDPGRRRDTSIVGPEHWDAQYPIRFDWECTAVPPRTYAASELLNLIKRTLPFILRFQRHGTGGHAPHMPAVQSARVDVPVPGMQFWELMRLIVKELPGWQATALPGYAILYELNEVNRNNPANYPAATRIWRNPPR